MGVDIAPEERLHAVIIKSAPSVLQRRAIAKVFVGGVRPLDCDSYAASEGAHESPEQNSSDEDNDESGGDDEGLALQSAIDLKGEGEGDGAYVSEGLTFDHACVPNHEEMLPRNRERLKAAEDPDDESRAEDGDAPRDDC